MLVGLARVRLPARVTEKLLDNARFVAMLDASVSAVTSPRCPAVNVCTAVRVAAALAVVLAALAVFVVVVNTASRVAMSTPSNVRVGRYRSRHSTASAWQSSIA